MLFETLYLQINKILCFLLKNSKNQEDYLYNCYFRSQNNFFTSFFLRFFLNSKTKYVILQESKGKLLDYN